MLLENLDFVQELETKATKVIGGSEAVGYAYIKPDYGPGITVDPDPGEEVKCYYDPTDSDPWDWIYTPIGWTCTVSA